MPDSHSTNPVGTVAHTPQASADAPSETTATPPSQPDAGTGSTRAQRGSPTVANLPSGLPVVPGYAVTREVARGGMGVVYAALDPKFERSVAIKVMHPGQDGERFVVEAKVTAQLPHPGVPPVYALGALPDGRPFLAMKLIEGRTLADELRAATSADLPRLLGAFERICETVGFAHARGVIHRDLKPANVMVGAFGEVLVMDWGLAKELKSAERTFDLREALENPQHNETITGQVKGTPAYMAPEQARGEPVDARADVFALGGLLAAVLTGKAPFAGSTVVDTVRKAADANLTECFARLDTTGADAELLAVAKTCLAPLAADRYPDGAAVAVAVAAYRTGVEERLRRAERERAAAEAKAAEEVNTRREAEARAAEGRKRRRAQLLLAGAVILLAATGGAFAWYSDHQAQRERGERAEFEAKQARDEGERKALAAVADERARAAKEQAEQGIAANLKLATDLRKQYKFQEAAAALAQAAELAKGAPERADAVKRARDDLAFVVQLDDIRYRKWAWVMESGGRGRFDLAGAPPAYRAAFASHELDLTTLDPATAGARVAAAGVRTELVAAVDDWALHEPDAQLRDRLLDVVRRADPDPRVARLRAPAVRADTAAVAALAAAPDPFDAPAVAVLAQLMMQRGLEPAPLLAAARRRHPTDFELAFLLGHQYKDAKDGRQVGPYEAACALRPDNPTAWFNLGVALSAQGDVSGSVAAYRKAVALDPSDIHARNNLGNGLLESGDPDGAAAEFRQAVKLDPKYAKARGGLGEAFRAKGEFRAAAEEFREAIRIAPKDPNIHVSLGAVLVDLGQPAAAATSHRRALEIDPAFARAHNGLGVALAVGGDLPAATDAFRAAVRHEPAWAPGHANLARALRVGGDLTGAAAAYKKAHTLDPKDLQSARDLGSVLFELRDWEGAIAVLAHASRLAPRHAPTHVNLGIAYAQQKKYGDAIAAARAAVEADKKFAPAHALLGDLLARTGDMDSARAALAAAAKLDRRYEGMLAKLPALPVAPPPRPVTRP